MILSRSLYGVLAAAFLLAACQTGYTTFKNVAVASWDVRPPITISGLLSRPKGNGPFPAVVLLHSCGGFRPHMTDDWPAYLNKLGYVTLAVDTYGSRGLGSCPNGLEHDTIQMMKDAYGALKHLATQPYVKKNKIAVMGFSAGGISINNFVNANLKPRGELEFAAGVGLYANCKHLGDGTKLLYPLMEVFGDKDLRVLETCGILNNKSIEIHVLPGAYHAFDAAPGRGRRTDIGGNPMLYDWNATKKSRELTKMFLAKHLGK